MISDAEAVRHLLAARGSLTMRPTGTSMLPAIFPGDRVTLTRPRSLKVGDIVLVDGPRLHRVVAIDPERGTVTTRGDASSTDDPPVPVERVVGVVLAVRPAIRARLFFLARALAHRALSRFRRRP